MICFRPVVFSIFINDVIHNIQDRGLIYNCADDSTICIRQSDPNILRKQLVQSLQTQGTTLWNISLSGFVSVFLCSHSSMFLHDYLGAMLAMFPYQGSHFNLRK